MRGKGLGSVAARVGITNVAADQVGMLGNVINVLAVRDVLEARGHRGLLMSPRRHRVGIHRLMCGWNRESTYHDGCGGLPAGGRVIHGVGYQGD